MAYKGMLKLDGTPLLGPGGLKPVLMESPCPFARWDIQNTGGLYFATLSHSFSSSGGYVRLTATTTTNMIVGFCDVMMIMAPGDSTIAMALTSTRPDALQNYSCNITTCGGAYINWDNLRLRRSNGTGSVAGSLPVPYVRYRLRLLFAGEFWDYNPYAPGDYLQLDIAV